MEIKFIRLVQRRTLLRFISLIIVVSFFNRAPAQAQSTGAIDKATDEIDRRAASFDTIYPSFKVYNKSRRLTEETRSRNIFCYDSSSKLLKVEVFDSTSFSTAHLTFYFKDSSLIKLKTDRLRDGRPASEVLYFRDEKLFKQIGSGAKFSEHGIVSRGHHFLRKKRPA